MSVAVGRTLSCYIDETGDRGTTAEGRSPIFGMCAVIVDQQSAQQLRNAIDQLRVDFKVPEGKVMSWKSNLKTAARRLQAAKVLSAVQGVTLLYVYYDKSKLNPNSYVSDHQRSYDYAAHMLHKAILWYTAYGTTPNSTVAIRYGHVRGHNHAQTKETLAQLAISKSLPTGCQRDIKWVAADTHPESQAADLYAGFLKSAIWPDEFGNVDGQYLMRVWHKIRQADLCGKGGRCAIPLGILSMPENRHVTKLEWFACQNCKQAA